MQDEGPLTNQRPFFDCAVCSVEFDARIDSGERQGQIEILDPQDLIAASNHCWCRREHTGRTRPDVSCVLGLLERQIGHETR